MSWERAVFWKPVFQNTVFQGINYTTHPLLLNATSQPCPINASNFHIAITSLSSQQTFAGLPTTITPLRCQLSVQKERIPHCLPGCRHLVTITHCRPVLCDLCDRFVTRRFRHDRMISGPVLYADSIIPFDLPDKAVEEKMLLVGSCVVNSLQPHKPQG